MAGIMTILLRNLQFYAHHGLHGEERKTGCTFEVNVAIDYSTGDEVLHHIADTINYATVYEMIKEKMVAPSDLLETVAMQLSEGLKTRFPQIRKISISIFKLHPPIPNFAGQVGVRFEKEF